MVYAPHPLKIQNSLNLRYKITKYASDPPLPPWQTQITVGPHPIHPTPPPGNILLDQCMLHVDVRKETTSFFNLMA